MKSTILYITILLLFSSCYKEEDYKLSNLQNDIIVSLSNNNISADGESTIDITIEIPLETKTESSKITLTTTNGSFENGSKSIDINATYTVMEGIDKKTVTTKLISSQKIEDATIKATIGDLSTTKKVYFKKAYPESVITNIPAFTISYGYETTTLSTKVTRSFGKPSLNTIGSLKIIDSIGNEFGQFLNYNTNFDENGLLENKFSLGIDSCYCSKLYIITKTLINETTYASDTTNLIVQ